MTKKSQKSLLLKIIRINEGYMSKISNILFKLEGTEEAETLAELEKSYENIEILQKEWYRKSRFLCPDGCGSCCQNFEPDLLESEALYMAAWLLENQAEVAEQIKTGKFPFDNGKTCPFFDASKAYHCSIYEGRPCICRLFGASGSKDKQNKTVWKPCKFYPEEKLKLRNPPLAHQQYSENQIKNIFNCLPPVMSDFMENIVSINPDSTGTKLIREILPETISRLEWIIKLNGK